MERSYQYNIKAEKHVEFKSSNLQDAQTSFEYVRQFFFDDIFLYESGFIVLLDDGMNTIGWVKISQGGISSTIIDVRLICKCAIDTLASGVILVHNHPSGRLVPSEQDKILTKKVEQGLKMFDIKLIDHLIISDKKYYSFAENSII